MTTPISYMYVARNLKIFNFNIKKKTTCILYTREIFSVRKKRNEFNLAELSILTYLR